MKVNTDKTDYYEWVDLKHAIEIVEHFYDILLYDDINLVRMDGLSILDAISRCLRYQIEGRTHIPSGTINSWWYDKTRLQKS